MKGNGWPSGRYIQTSLLAHGVFIGFNLLPPPSLPPSPCFFLIRAWNVFLIRTRDIELQFEPTFFNIWTDARCNSLEDYSFPTCELRKWLALFIYLFGKIGLVNVVFIHSLCCDFIFDTDKSFLYLQFYLSKKKKKKHSTFYKDKMNKNIFLWCV